MIFDNFPYTNFHEMNLDWILHKVKEMDSKLDNFVDLNAVKYHDPIGWDITTQYAQNEIVKDPNTGILYMAKQPVPQGIALTNGDYWLEIGDMSYNIDFLKQAIAVPDEGTAVISANAYNAGDVIWWQDELYQVIVDIAIGDSFVINTNIKKITLGEQITQLEAGQADLEQTIETDLADLEQELAFKLMSNPNILLMGDSTINRMFASGKLTDYFPGSTVTNVSTSGAKWINVVSQVSAITNTPDVIIIGCGGNDVTEVGNYTAGTVFGPPNVTTHTYPASPSLTFDCIKYVFGELRKRYPRALIYYLRRSDRNGIDFNIRNYLYFFTEQIAAEYGVDLIDLQSLVNYAYFVDEQRVIYNADAGVNEHYNNTMYERICNRLAGILVSGSPTTWNTEPPESYFIPNFGNDETTIDGLASMLNYVANHCRNRNGASCFNKMVTVYGSSRYTSGWLLRSTGRCRLGLQSANGFYYADGDIANDIVTGTKKVLNSTAIELAQNLDLNTVSEPGLYWVPGDQTVTNLPSDMTNSNKMFTLLEYETGNYLWQWVHNRYNAAVWYRFGTKGTPINWRAWTKIGT